MVSAPFYSVKGSYVRICGMSVRYLASDLGIVCVCARKHFDEIIRTTDRTKRGCLRFLSIPFLSFDNLIP